MEIIKSIENAEAKTRFDIFKDGGSLYGFNYLEYYSSCGWRLIATEHSYTKEALEEIFG